MESQTVVTQTILLETKKKTSNIIYRVLKLRYEDNKKTEEEINEIISVVSEEVSDDFNLYLDFFNINCLASIYSVL